MHYCHKEGGKKEKERDKTEIKQNGHWRTLNWKNKNVLLRDDDTTKSIKERAVAT